MLKGSQDAAWPTPVVFTRLVRGEDGMDGEAGDAGLVADISYTNGQTFVEVDDAGWDPGVTTTAEVTFRSGGNDLSRVAYRFVYDSDSNIFNEPTQVAHSGGNLNVSRVSETVSTNRREASVIFQYNFNGETATIRATVVAIRSGRQGDAGLTFVQRFGQFTSDNNAVTNALEEDPDGLAPGVWFSNPDLCDGAFTHTSLRGGVYEVIGQNYSSVWTFGGTTGGNAPVGVTERYTLSSSSAQSYNAVAGVTPNYRVTFSGSHLAALTYTANGLINSFDNQVFVGGATYLNISGSTIPSAVSTGGISFNGWAGFSDNSVSNHTNVWVGAFGSNANSSNAALAYITSGRSARRVYNGGELAATVIGGGSPASNLIAITGGEEPTWISGWNTNTVTVWRTDLWASVSQWRIRRPNVLPSNARIIGFAGYQSFHHITGRRIAAQTNQTYALRRTSNSNSRRLELWRGISTTTIGNFISGVWNIPANVRTSGITRGCLRLFTVATPGGSPQTRAWAFIFTVSGIYYYRLPYAGTNIPGNLSASDWTKLAGTSGNEQDVGWSGGRFWVSDNNGNRVRSWTLNANFSLTANTNNLPTNSSIRVTVPGGGSRTTTLSGALSSSQIAERVRARGMPNYTATRSGNTVIYTGNSQFATSGNLTGAITNGTSQAVGGSIGTGVSGVVGYAQSSLRIRRGTLDSTISGLGSSSGSTLWAALRSQLETILAGDSVDWTIANVIEGGSVVGLSITGPNETTITPDFIFTFTGGPSGGNWEGISVNDTQGVTPGYVTPSVIRFTKAGGERNGTVDIPLKPGVSITDATVMREITDGLATIFMRPLPIAGVPNQLRILSIENPYTASNITLTANITQGSSPVGTVTATQSTLVRAGTRDVIDFRGDYWSQPVNTGRFVT